ncbi:MAG: hemolysin family protein [Planctomycetota bacterium]|nr:hemolysin family protein [Planctomycetota bacterium]
MTAVFVIVALLGLNALCVAAEFAVIQAKEGRLRAAAEEGNRSARLLLPVLLDPERLDRYISTCQLGITVTSLVLGAYSEFALAHGLQELFVSRDFFEIALAHSVATIVVLVCVTLLQIVLGEQVPKSMALHRPDRIALVTVWPILFWQKTFGFLITFLTFVSRCVLRLLGAKAEVHRHVHSRQEIDIMMEQSHEKGAIESEQHERLQQVLDLDIVTASQLMVPRPEISAVDIDAEEDASLQAILDGRYTRLPVYRGNIDEVVGVIHTKDLARNAVENDGIEDWRQLIRPMFFVNEGMTADRMLTLFRAKRTQQAVVMDEFGGVAGMVTLEDVLTYVFGEVEDEFSETSENAERLSNGTVRLPGRMRLDECDEWVGTEWRGASNTVSGLITEHLGQLPAPGAVIFIDGVEVVVEEVSRHVVTSVIATPLADPCPGPEGDPQIQASSSDPDGESEVKDAGEVADD